VEEVAQKASSSQPANDPCPRVNLVKPVAVFVQTSHQNVDVTLNETTKRFPIAKNSTIPKNVVVHQNGVMKATEEVRSASTHQNGEPTLTEISKRFSIVKNSTIPRNGTVIQCVLSKAAVEVAKSSSTNNRGLIPRTAAAEVKHESGCPIQPIKLKVSKDGVVGDDQKPPTSDVIKPAMRKLDSQTSETLAYKGFPRRKNSLIRERMKLFAPPAEKVDSETVKPVKGVVSIYF